MDNKRRNDIQIADHVEYTIIFFQFKTWNIPASISKECEPSLNHVFCFKITIFIVCRYSPKQICGFNLLTLNLLNLFNGIIHLPYLELFIIISVYHDETLKLVSQQYRAWLDCMDVHAGLTLCWWQRVISFGSSRLMVKIINICQSCTKWPLCHY